MLEERKFKDLYDTLNKEQKEAVDAIEGPVMVIAGPGTGKTQILSLRIANILRKTDITPDAILALTFTESATYSMRQRLTHIIGSSAYRVNIFTFHGFCNEVIRNFPDYFPRIIGSSTASDVERIKIIEDVIKKTKLKHLKPFGDPAYYVKPVLSAIQKLKRENLSPKKLKGFIKKQEKEFEAQLTSGEKFPKVEQIKAERKLEKNKELLVLYERYEKTLAEMKLYDYEDMILEVIRSFEKNEELLLTLQEEYQYILADEHQDANNAQNRILELLSSFHKSPNLFIVGDEKQAVFRFQGASLENFLYFKELYPEAIILTLKNNYRSTQIILDASHSLIDKNEVNDQSLRQKLSASGSKGIKEKQISLLEFSKPIFEYAFLADDINQKIKSGIKPQSIAIFYRNNSDAIPLIKAFEYARVPFEVYSDQSLFLDENIRKLIVFLKAINSFGDQTFLAELLFIDFLEFDNLDIYKMLNFCRKENINLFDCLSSDNFLKKSGVKNYKSINEFYKKLNLWTRLSKNKSLVDFLEIIIRESGYLKFLLNQGEVWGELNKLEAFFDQAKSLAESQKEAKLENFIDYLEVLKEHNILVKAGHDYGPQREAVKLMTAHKAKGLEFDYVYLTGAFDGHWGNLRNIKHFHLPELPFDTGIDDERRLFYVALTRAKKEIYLSFSREDENQKQRLPVQFISEIDDKFLFKVDTSLFEKKFAKENAIRKKGASKKTFKEERGYLRELFFDRGFSVTALNNFLECPWKYFFENLLRIPKAPTKSQMYGIAVHKALEEFFKLYKKEGKPESKKLLQFFERALRMQPLDKDDFEETLAKGQNSLEKFYLNYKESWSDRVIIELKIGGVVLDNIKIGKKEYPIVLTGKLDKVELLDDDTVNVVDYKTSQPKTRNQILGKTKDSQGGIYRQLVFYKILLDRYEEGKFKMLSAEIDFTEPDKASRFKKEKFFVSDEETSELIKVIKNSAREIAKFSFWNKYCDNRDCHYCALRKSMSQ